MASRLGLTALLAGVLASGCGDEQLNPVLEEAYVFAQFQEDQYCGLGENFNGLKGNVYGYAATNSLVVHSPMGSGSCGDAKIADLDVLYVEQFLGPIRCEDIERADERGKLIFEGLYDPNSETLWALKVLQLDPELKSLWPLDEG